VYVAPWKSIANEWFNHKNFSGGAFSPDLAKRG
jgi:hypothetical protein